MSGKGAFTLDQKTLSVIPSWFAAILLLAVTAAIGGTLGSVMRPIFILSCAAVGWYTWRESPAAHLKAALLLFAFAPFVRRVVDLSAGYDQSGTMLIGPLLAIIIPAPRLLRLFDRDRPFDSRMMPLLVVAGCILYTAALSLFQGNWNDAASGGLKWMAPLLYAAVLLNAAERDEVIEAATSAFAIILPLTGLYGIFQYIDPPDWDRYWMQFASILSAGLPVPFGVRTFSTMNSPASFASFTAAGLLLLSFRRSGWLAVVLAAPALLAFMLSLYRTGWVSLAAGLLFCLAFTATRKRAGAILVALAIGGMIAATLPPFSDVIGDRLATLGQGSQDGSAQERLEEYTTLWNSPNSSLFGVGFTSVDVGVAGAMPIDGMIVTCWVLMGIGVGIVCLTGFLWAIWQAIQGAFADKQVTAIIVGALACGALTQFPLANLGSAELGFLFWTLIVQIPKRPLPAMEPSRL